MIDSSPKECGKSKLAVGKEVIENFVSNIRHRIDNHKSPISSSKSKFSTPKEVKADSSRHPVIYNVKQSETTYRRPGRFTFYEQPSEKFMKRFSYKSKRDTLMDDWHRMIKKFSDRNPIHLER